MKCTTRRDILELLFKKANDSTAQKELFVRSVFILPTLEFFKSATQTPVEKFWFNRVFKSYKTAVLNGSLQDWFDTEIALLPPQGLSSHMAFNTFQPAADAGPAKNSTLPKMSF